MVIKPDELIGNAIVVISGPIRNICHLNFDIMKNLALIIIASLSIFAFSCKEKDTTSERFRLLTEHIWTSDSLLANGADASQPGQMLANLKGDVRFNNDGTGSFGEYTGTWELYTGDSQLSIRSSALPIPMVTTEIVELTSTSLKITTSLLTVNIRMTFKAK